MSISGYRKFNFLISEMISYIRKSLFKIEKYLRFFYIKKSVLNIQNSIFAWYQATHIHNIPIIHSIKCRISKYHSHCIYQIMHIYICITFELKLPRQWSCHKDKQHKKHHNFRLSLFGMTLPNRHMNIWITLQLNYLTHIKHPNYRKPLTILRISAHNLSIERGRYQNLLLEQRLCTLRDTNHISSQNHILTYNLFIKTTVYSPN